MQNKKKNKKNQNKKPKSFYSADINATPLPHVRVCRSPFLSCQPQNLSETLSLEHQASVCDMPSVPAKKARS